MPTQSHTHVLVLLAASLVLAACRVPNPSSCIAVPTLCKTGTTCDMKTGECIERDGSVGDALDGADETIGDGAGDWSQERADASDGITAAANGEACASNGACASTHCADGVCCNTACSGTCMSCALGGTKGTCTAVKSADDSDSCPSSMKTCDAKGACGAKNGQTCMIPGDCVSGNCVDGVCCDSTCGDKCFSCALAGTVGTCSPVRNADDTDSCSPSTSTCDAVGACKLKNGPACGTGTECASGNCADGVCCNTGCTGSCLSCSLSGSFGTCSSIKGTEDLDTCSGTYTCSPLGACRLKDTQPCTMNEDCASSICGRFYRDTDGDGYGDTTMSATFCTAAPSATPNWAVRGDDCCDKDANVHPGQTAYQASESTACGTTFDYDCNGSEDRQYPFTYSCTTASDGSCDPISHDGWSGGVPACGKTGNLSHCGPSFCGPLECCVVTSTDTGAMQRCR